MFQLFNKILSNLKLQIKYKHFSTSTSFKNENDNSQYITVKVSKDDYLPVLKLMHNAFYPHEPTCACLGVVPNPVMDERAIKDMAEGMSIMMRHKHSGDIAGACINCSVHPWDPNHTEKLASSCRCSKVRKLLLFYAYMTRKPDLWSSYGVKKVFEMAYLFVSPEHRRKGLSYRLLGASKNIAREKGFQVIRCDATSFITSKLCEKMGMKVVDEIQYSTYFGNRLEPVINPPLAHDTVKIYIDENIEILKELVDK